MLENRGGGLTVLDVLADTAVLHPDLDSGLGVAGPEVNVDLVGPGLPDLRGIPGVRADIHQQDRVAGHREDNGLGVVVPTPAPAPSQAPSATSGTVNADDAGMVTYSFDGTNPTLTDATAADGWA